jgi:hypothetical protein
MDTKLLNGFAYGRKMKMGEYLGLIAVGIFAVVALGRSLWDLPETIWCILTHTMTPSRTTVVVGAFYSLGGLSILTLRKWGGALGIACIGAKIAGRVYLVASGMAPSTGSDAIKIIIGGLIAVGVIAYVLTQWRKFK